MESNVKQSSDQKLTLYGLELPKNSLNYNPNRESSQFHERYINLELIYEMSLAPTKVFVGEDSKAEGRKVAVKMILKDKLHADYQFELIRTEMAIHAFLSEKDADSIIQLYEYFELEEEFIMVMEYCNQPDYFEARLEEVLF